AMQEHQFRYAREVRHGGNHVVVGEAVIGETPDPARPPTVIRRMHVVVGVRVAMMNAMLAGESNRIRERETGADREQELKRTARLEGVMREVAVKSRDRK